MRAQDILLIVALPAEAQSVFDGVASRVRFSGIGKVNATYAVTRALMEERPRLVLNVGTAGSPAFRTHELVECTRFVQRDIDLSPLGFAKCTTPFDDSPAVLEVPRRFAQLPEGVCGTGDNFEVALGPAPDGLPHASTASTGAAAALPIPRPNVIEMEAYAIAKVCWREKIPLVCVKYITDGSDANASADWAANLPRAAARFREIYDQLLRMEF